MISLNVPFAAFDAAKISSHVSVSDPVSVMTTPADGDSLPGMVVAMAESESESLEPVEQAANATTVSIAPVVHAKANLRESFVMVRT